MKAKYAQILGMCFTLTMISHPSYAEVHINSLAKTNHQTLPMKTGISPIEKALSQQKSNYRVYHTQDESKVLHFIQGTASQNFFALQNQKFTRFVQNLFSS